MSVLVTRRDRGVIEMVQGEAVEPEEMRCHLKSPRQSPLEYHCLGTGVTEALRRGPGLSIHQVGGILVRSCRKKLFLQEGVVRNVQGYLKGK